LLAGLPVCQVACVAVYTGPAWFVTKLILLSLLLLVLVLRWRLLLLR
jgi:hypothetical protein